MDSSRKPEKTNPRRYANVVSHLLFVWAMPLLYRGSKYGLHTEDLTKCLPPIVHSSSTMSCRGKSAAVFIVEMPE